MISFVFCKRKPKANNESPGAVDQNDALTCKMYLVPEPSVIIHFIFQIKHIK
jgi:hypothetical protein